ncbi:MAG: hypothetical protein KF764_28415 [Labilithrix sp.]|nr:hypothetical protein [Labilithrix sp.]MBX3224006.1 hypothetical protein [Labilithrix sp.]
MRIGACAIAAAVLLWHLPAAAGDPASAREQLKIGYLLAQDNKCDEALPHLLESLRLDPKAITLINLADCEEKVGKLSDAMSHWVDARARAQSEGLRPIEEEATARATALEPRLARLTIVLAPSAPKDAVVERDGVVLGAPSMGIPLPLDPGAHTIVVKVKGRDDATTRLALVEGEAKRVELEAGPLAAGTAPPPPPVGEPTTKAPMSPLVFIGFGVAAAGVAAGSVTGVMALGAGSDAKSACPDLRCTDAGALDDVGTGRTLGTVSTISFIVAGAGAAVGVYGLLFAKPSATKPAPSVGVSVTPASVALRGSF